MQPPRQFDHRGDQPRVGVVRLEIDEVCRAREIPVDLLHVAGAIGLKRRLHRQRQPPFGIEVGGGIDRHLFEQSRARRPLAFRTGFASGSDQAPSAFDDEMPTQLRMQLAPVVDVQVVRVRITAAFIGPIVGDADEQAPSRLQYTGKCFQQGFGMLDMFQGFERDHEIDRGLRTGLECIGKIAGLKPDRVGTVAIGRISDGRRTGIDARDAAGRRQRVQDMRPVAKTTRGIEDRIERTHEACGEFVAHHMRIGAFARFAQHVRMQIALALERCLQRRAQCARWLKQRPELRGIVAQPFITESARGRGVLGESVRDEATFDCDS